MKLQDLAAIIGGVIKSVIVGFSLFAQIYNSVTMKRYLIDKFFVRISKEKNEDLTHLRYNTECYNNNFKSEANLICQEDKNQLESLNNLPNKENKAGNKYVFPGGEAMRQLLKISI
jgi:hypothetical protein